MELTRSERVHLLTLSALSLIIDNQSNRKSLNATRNTPGTNDNTRKTLAGVETNDAEVVQGAVAGSTALRKHFGFLK